MSAETEGQKEERVSYISNYSGLCDVCGDTPTVVVVAKNEPVRHLNLCGPCCFGTAEALDPSYWETSK